MDEEMNIFMSENEQMFLTRTRDLLCEDLLGTIHDEFAGTYNLSPKVRIRNLFHRVEYVRGCMDNKEMPLIVAGALADVIKFCLVWMYFLVDWEKVEKDEN